MTKRSNKMGFSIDSKEGREAFTRGGWDKIPASEWEEAHEALKKYASSRGINLSSQKKERTPKSESRKVKKSSPQEKRSTPTSSQPKSTPSPMVAKPFSSKKGRG